MKLQMLKYESYSYLIQGVGNDISYHCKSSLIVYYHHIQVYTCIFF